MQRCYPIAITLPVLPDFNSRGKINQMQILAAGAEPNAALTPERPEADPVVSSRSESPYRRYDARVLFDAENDDLKDGCDQRVS